MRETHFIQQNKEKWGEFERIVYDPNPDPDKLHDVFIQVTDDLSHARTFYPARSVRAYLNGVAQLIFTDIYKRKKSPLSKIRFFFTDDLPQVVYESRWSFFWAIVFFLLSFGIGYFSSVKDPEFLKTILGDSYVEMTVENIKSGDPMAVYKKSGRFNMTFSIMENNMRVTLMYFILGIFAGVGSVAMMMYNGVMLGAFLQFFAQNNLVKESNLTVWMHGTLEISAIVIGTAAGITMGSGLLFPGTHTRLQAFQMSARRGIKIMVGVMVMLFFAAIVEGNLTRHTGAGDLFRGLFIGACFISIVGYYGWLPFYKAKKGFKTKLKDNYLPPDNFYKIVYSKIKNSGEIFGDTFLFFKKYMKHYLWTASLTAVAFCAVVFTLESQPPSEIFQLDTNIFNQFPLFAQFFVNDKIWFLPYVNGLIYAGLAFAVFRLILRGELVGEKTRNQEAVSFFKIWVVSALLMFWVALNMALYTIFFLIIMPFMAQWMYLMYRDGFGVINGVRHAWWLIGSGLASTYGTHYIMLSVSYLIFAFLNSAFLYFYMLFVGWNMSFVSGSHFDEMVVILTAFMSAFTMFLNFMLFFTAMGFQYYSLLEINEANSVLEKIKLIGVSRKLQGMARE